MARYSQKSGLVFTSSDDEGDGDDGNDDYYY